jgi:hypothetical protein
MLGVIRVLKDEEYSIAWWATRAEIFANANRILTHTPIVAEI